MSRIILRHLFSGLGRRPTKNRVTLNVEGLEERRNPVTATMNGSLLDVTGTGSGLNDRILVIQNGNGISVFNQLTNQFVPIDTGGNFVDTIDQSFVSGIRVFGNGGNDFIDINSGGREF